MVQRFGHTVFSRTAVPFGSASEVLPYALAVIVHRTELELSGWEPLPGCCSHPLDCSGAVFSGQRRAAETGLGLGYPCSAERASHSSPRSVLFDTPSPAKYISLRWYIARASPF